MLLVLKNAEKVQNYAKASVPWSTVHVLSSWYWKHGYFSCGKISQLCQQDVTHGCSFHEFGWYVFISVSWCNFCMVGNVWDNAKNAKFISMWKFPRLQYLHVVFKRSLFSVAFHTDCRVMSTWRNTCWRNGPRQRQSYWEKEDCGAQRSGPGWTNGC